MAEEFEVRNHYTGWHRTDETTAHRYAEWLMGHIVMVPLEKRAEYIRERHVRRTGT